MNSAKSSFDAVMTKSGEAFNQRNLLHDLKHHMQGYQAFFAFVVSLSFIIDGLSIIRIYARVFPGPHVKSQYEMAYRSS